jgi:U4/U6 small nuclear ribonucleoprotein PRP3
MYVCMYVYIYVCMYVMYVCMYVYMSCMNLSIQIIDASESFDLSSILPDSSSVRPLPPPNDGGVCPLCDWWDESFLPRDLRDARKHSRFAADADVFSKLSINNVRTYKFVQHPSVVRPLGGESTHGEAPLPMYLTKKERKRMRKAARSERETEKRDKMMLGLIAAPEPKFKLSNFMKVLGDQAVADPSKVEMRVLEQMQKRQLNHEMRNQAGKLTPAEKKNKQSRKMQEDTSRLVHVAVFGIKALANPKHKFKVDVNAQQNFLTGTGMFVVVVLHV